MTDTSLDEFRGDGEYSAEHQGFRAWRASPGVLLIRIQHVRNLVKQEGSILRLSRQSCGLGNQSLFFRIDW